MSKAGKIAARIASGSIEVKSKFEAEFRRYGLAVGNLPTFDEFVDLVKRIHKLHGFMFTIWYTDPEGDLLPLSNNDNFAKALTTAQPLLRVIVLRKGQTSVYDVINAINSESSSRHHRYRHEPRIAIGEPEDFRRVSSIIDVDLIPPSQRRVRLMKNGSDRPLGFYIRDGTSIRVTASGVERIPGIFISRLVPGGLAESTGLLAVNDEILEVNGIDVTGKTLDQVTDMMVANSANLIVTVKPVNQHNNVELCRGSGRSSKRSIVSGSGSVSAATEHNAPTSADQEDDVIKDHLMLNVGHSSYSSSNTFRGSNS